MANCPNCGSEHIVLKNDTSASWAGALIGGLFFGSLGGAVLGAVATPTEVNELLFRLRDYL